MKARERAKLLNTMTIMLKGLEGRVTTIELRNESSIRGRIDNVDFRMNTTLTDVVVIASDGRQVMKCEQFFIQVLVLSLLSVDLTASVQVILHNTVQ